MTAWSRRVNAAAHRGVGEKAAPKPDLFAEATAAEVDADGMATLKTLVALARERPSFAVTVEVATAKSGAQAFKVAASESGPTVRKVDATGGTSTGDGDGSEILQILTDTMVETPDLVAVFASVGHEALWANDAFVTAIPIREADKIWLVELLDEWSKGHYEVKVLPALVKFGRWRGRLTLVTGIDETTAVSAVIVAHRDTDGEITAVSLVARPLTEIGATAADLGPESQFAALVENSTDIIAVIGPDGVIAYASPAAAIAFGRPDGDLAGANLLELTDPDNRPAAIADLVRVDDLGVGEPATLRVLGVDGEARHLEVIVSDLTENPAIGAFVLNGRDVTDRRSGASEVAARAYTDALTGLPSRMRILDRLGSELMEHQQSVTVLLVDFDRLKGINETFGREVGDDVLRELARRMAAEIDDDALLGRLGSDEFVVVLSGDDKAEGAALGERLRAAAAQPLTAGTAELTVTASVGVASGQPGDDPDELLTDAGRAMAQAKSTGRDRVEVFTDQLAAAATRRRTVEQELRKALDRDGIGVHYQPVVDVDSEQTVGAEALLRVDHADGAVLTPAEFIEAAESTGLIARLGAQVLEITCEQLAAWSTAGRSSLHEISVNVSPRQLADPNLPSTVIDRLNEAGVAPERLCLEIGESILIGAQPIVDQTIAWLRELGVRIGLDDFGAGQSSLGYLKRFPLDFVKIDKTLISGLGTNEQDTAIVRATIELAHNLGLSVTAVGVESEDQLEMLQILGCDKAQGYLFAPPLAADEFTARVAGGLR